MRLSRGAPSGAPRFFLERAIRALCPLALAASLLLTAPAQAAFPGANGKIAWSSSSVQTINPDGTGSAGFCDFDCFSEFSDPGWSADGAKVAFVQDVEYGDGIYKVEVANADFSSAHLIGGFGFSRSPAWSPDGRTIAVAGAGIGVLDANGTDPYARPQPLTTNSADYEPSWSPDGTKIVFERGITSGQYSIFVMNADGTAQTNLSNGTRIDSHANWSPDGSRIAFARSDGTNDDIWVMNSDGSAQMNLTNDPTLSDYSPAWSPDGKQIAFMTKTLTGPLYNYSLKVMNADGSNSHVVVNAGDDDVDWQPLPTAAYPHPHSASSLSASLVPTFRPCGTGANPTDGQHSPPLSTQACLPPLSGSNVARIGPSSVGAASFTIVPGDSDATNGDQANVTLSTSLSDVKTVAGADYVPNASGPDLTEITRLRLTDKANNYGGASATATEYDFRVPIECAATSDPGLGSSCSANTSADALLPGFITEQRQTVIQAFRVRVDDAGTNGTTGDSDDRIFATQGIYVP